LGISSPETPQPEGRRPLLRTSGLLLTTSLRFRWFYINAIPNSPGRTIVYVRLCVCSRVAAIGRVVFQSLPTQHLAGIHGVAMGADLRLKIRGAHQSVFCGCADFTNRVGCPWVCKMALGGYLGDNLAIGTPGTTWSCWPRVLERAPFRAGRSGRGDDFPLSQLRQRSLVRRQRSRCWGHPLTCVASPVYDS